MLHITYLTAFNMIYKCQRIYIEELLKKCCVMKQKGINCISRCETSFLRKFKISSKILFCNAKACNLNDVSNHSTFKKYKCFYFTYHKKIISSQAFNRVLSKTIAIDFVHILFKIKLIYAAMIFHYILTRIFD